MYIYTLFGRNNVLCHELFIVSVSTQTGWVSQSSQYEWMDG